MFEEPPNETFQVGPTKPLPLQFRVAASDKVPEGAVLLETRFRGHTIARGLADAEGGETLARQDEVTAPLLLQAEEHDGGIDGRILALFPIPEDQIRDIMQAGGRDDADEPWKASVPSFEDEPGMEIPEGAVPMAAVLLGTVKRFAGNRQHPDDPRAEAESLLQAILAGAGRDADSAAIDDLLDSI